MGIFRTTVLTGLAGASVSAGCLAALAAKNTIITPLSPDDAIWSSKLYTRYNPFKYPTMTEDICVKRIPLDKIRPELLKKEDDLVLEFCRGIWSGWGYTIQRKYLEKKYRGPETEEHLWSKDQLATSNYEKGICFTDHFEVVEKTKDSITVRCGDSPRNQTLRAVDGLFVISAKVCPEKKDVELQLKTCFFSSNEKAEPMPFWLEELHQWYSRVWSETGSRRLLK